MHLDPLPVHLTALWIIVWLISVCVLMLAYSTGLIELSIGTFSNTFLHMDLKPSPGSIVLNAVFSLFSLYSHTHTHG